MSKKEKMVVNSRLTLKFLKKRSSTSSKKPKSLVMARATMLHLEPEFDHVVEEMDWEGTGEYANYSTVLDQKSPKNQGESLERHIQGNGVLPQGGEEIKKIHVTQDRVDATGNNATRGETEARKLSTQEEKPKPRTTSTSDDTQKVSVKNKDVYEVCNPVHDRANGVQSPPVPQGTGKPCVPEGGDGRAHGCNTAEGKGRKTGTIQQERTSKRAKKTPSTPTPKKAGDLHVVEGKNSVQIPQGPKGKGGQKAKASDLNHPEAQENQTKIIDKVPVCCDGREAILVLKLTPPSPIEPVEVQDPEKPESGTDDSMEVEPYNAENNKPAMHANVECLDRRPLANLTPGELQSRLEQNKSTSYKQAAPSESTRGSDTEKEPPSRQRTNNKILKLEAIIAETEEPEELWPACILHAVRTALGKVPRGGWPKIYEEYTKRFGTRLEYHKFMDKANEDVKKGKHIKVAEDDEKLLEEAEKEGQPERSLKQLRKRIEVKEIVAIKLAEMNSYEIEEAQKTYKLSSDTLNEEILEYINQAIGKYIRQVGNTPRNFTELARLLQVAQISYYLATFKEKEPSKWKQNIQNIIEKHQKNKDLLVKAGDNKATKAERSQAITYMRNKGLILNVPQDRAQAISDLEKEILMYQRRIEKSERRIKFNRDNRNFEKNTRRFLRSLSETVREPHKVSSQAIKDFWSTMWNKLETPIDRQKFEKYLYLAPEVEIQEKDFPTEQEFKDIIAKLPNWKAAGIDGIYNFFIKRMTCLHPALYEITKKTCLDLQAQEDWFWKGLTYLIEKGIATEGSHFRPITCMSNLYKLTTKCVCHVLTGIIQERGLLSEAQLATVRGVQGAKEQALVNIAINKAYKNKLKTAWIDVKKAFDSVDHTYLIAVLESLNLPEWITKFLKSTIAGWQLQIMNGRDHILTKKVERGILQGDSLSPILFVLCMDPLSRYLNATYPTVKGPTAKRLKHPLNHLLFVDDLKLIAETDETLKLLMDEVKDFFEAIGLEMNREKSATNSPSCEEDAVLLEGTQMYKYLGILENIDSIPSHATWEKVKKEILSRVDTLAQTSLNGRNMIKAINMYALSLLNYYTGLLRLEADDFEALDLEIRKVLVKNRLHYLNACPERLYLPREELGRGLGSAVFRSERMLHKFWLSLKEDAPVSTRRDMIVSIELTENTHMSLIDGFVRSKYFKGQDIKQILDEDLEKAQKKWLYDEISKKKNHPKLFKARENALVDMKESSLWLTHGNVSARDEAIYCALQDRNIFMGRIPQCRHCRNSGASVDHLATCCDRMLGHDYTRRHNEALKCISMHICKLYNLISRKRIKGYVMQETITDGTSEIRIDTAVKTELRISNNRPDIQVYDGRNKKIYIVEVGITSQARLTETENNKYRKYDLLAKELQGMHKMPVYMIPIVYTWEGIVTRFFLKHVEKIKLSKRVRAYIQTRILRLTYDCVTFERRRGLEEREPEDDLEESMQRLLGGRDEEEPKMKDDEEVKDGKRGRERDKEVEDEEELPKTSPKNRRERCRRREDSHPMVTRSPNHGNMEQRVSSMDCE